MRATTLAVMALACLGMPGVAQVPTTPDSAASTLEGTVRGRFDGRTRVLGFAVIEVVSAGAGRTAVADSAGRYVIRDLPAGAVRVRASHAGHESLTLTVLLPPDETVRVDLELRGNPVELPRLDVVGQATGALDARAARDRDAVIPELELQALELTPGVGQPGLIAAVRSLPGNDPANATDILFMRGSTADLKLVLLDGVPVSTPFHVAGLLRSFEPSVLSRADLYVGGAPARYDGGLTHILDLRTRRARRDRTRLSGSVDLLSASAAAETPLGTRAGLMVSGRSLHDLGRGPLGGPRPYGYRDLLLSIDADPTLGQSLSATGFWNAESVRLDFDQAPDDAIWSNRAASIAYRADLGGARLEVTAGASGYRAELPLQPSGEPGEPLPPPLRASANTDRMRLVAETVWGARSPLRLGVSFERITAAFEARGSDSSAESRASISTAGAFIDLTRPLSPGLTLRAGLRGDVFGGDEVRFAPRAALLWEIGPEALLTVAAGRYHQPTRTPDFEVERTLATIADEGVDPADLLPVASADHVILSLDQLLGSRVRLGLEGFWKRYDGLVASGGETVRSSGVDVRVLSSGDAGVAWLGYSLSWFWSTIDLSGRASEFAGRHLLSAGVSGSLLGPLRGEARVAYGAGLTYTSIPFVGSQVLNDALRGPGEPQVGDGTAPPIVGGLDEEFLRIDLEVYVLLEPNWGRRPWSVRPYVRILNALDQRDALFYTFQPWRPDAVRPLAERAFLPLLGVAISF